MTKNTLHDRITGGTPITIPCFLAYRPNGRTSYSSELAWGSTHTLPFDAKVKETIVAILCIVHLLMMNTRMNDADKSGISRYLHSLYDTHYTSCIQLCQAEIPLPFVSIFAVSQRNILRSWNMVLILADACNGSDNRQLIHNRNNCSFVISLRNVGYFNYFPRWIGNSDNFTWDMK